MKLRLIILFLLLNSLSFTQTWHKILSDVSVVAVDCKLNQLWAATENHGIFYYNKNTHIWRNLNEQNGYLLANATDDLVMAAGRVFIASSYGIYYCSINSNNWNHYILPGGYYPNWIRSIADDDTVVWFGTFQGVAAFSKTTSTFTKYNITKNSNGSTNNVTSVFCTPTEVWFGTEDGVQIYKKGTDITHDSSRIYYSKHNGFDNLSQYISVKAICIQDSIAWIGLEDYTPSSNPNYCIGGLYRFNRNSNQWKRFDKSSGLTGNGIHFIRINNDTLIAGLFTYINGIDFTGNGLLQMRTDSLNIKILNYSGSGVTDSNYFDLRAMDNHLWLAAGDGLYSTYDTALTSVEGKEPVINYALNQNYPNPFNPVTNISFSLKKESFVSLKLYDIMGNLVKVLIEESKESGRHNYTLNAKDLASGIYLYELTTSGLREVKKMVYLK